MQDFFGKNLGSIFSGVLISLAVGALAVIYESDKKNELLKAQLSFIASKVESVRLDVRDIQIIIQKSMTDRWTKTEHVRFSEKIDQKFLLLESRIREIEARGVRFEKHRLDNDSPLRK